MLFANSIAADAGLVPGLAVFGPAAGLPLSVMAAFVERPFFSRAGLLKKPLCYALQANLVSLFVGYFVTFLVIPLIYSPLILLWPWVAVLISSLVEWFYLKNSRPEIVRWKWIFAGNFVSAILCVLLLIFIAWLRSLFLQPEAILKGYHDGLTIGVAIASLLVFVYSFVATAGLHKLESTKGPGSPAIEDGEHGIQFLEPDPPQTPGAESR